MAGVSLHQVSKRFGRNLVIDDVDIDVTDGELCVFVGPSGCGKSTLLRLIAGLEDVSSGTVLIDGRDVTRLPPAARGVAMVFQSYALYPHMTVAQNITFGLRTARADKAETERRLAEAARMLQLEDLLARKPAQLSGGQRQRVAIGRAIVRHPVAFLFDEPLSNLDAALRARMRLELQELHRRLQTTMIHVTHDQVEAMTMADRIAVLNEGRVEQIGAPLELYERPANLFVAGFIGSPRMNLLDATIEPAEDGGMTATLAGGNRLLLGAPAPGLAPGTAIVLGIRPEHIALAEPGGEAIAARVAVVERLGVETIVHVAVGTTPLVVRATGTLALSPGEPVGLVLDPASIHLFGADGTALRHGSAQKGR